jgi:thioredoxin-like negative regulator of GroEL
MNEKKYPASYFLILLAAIPSLFALSASSSANTLTPEAERATKKGLVAAEQQQWNLAVRFFEDARKSAPLAPEIFFNLGLAESKIPAHELRSISWFNAYLTAAPQAPNLKAVQDMRDKLEIRTEGSIGKIIGQAKQLAGQFPNERDRISAYLKVGEAMAGTGDLNGAKQIVGSIPANYSTLLGNIAVALAKAGDVRGAKEVLSRMDTNDKIHRGSAYSAVAEVQADAGDISGALLTADVFDDDSGYNKYQALIAIAKAMHKAKRYEEAKKTFLRARNNTLKRSSKYFSYAVGIAQASVGDFKGALETAALTEDGGFRSHIYNAIKDGIDKQLNDGETGKTQSLQDLIAATQPLTDDDGKNRILSSIYFTEFERLIASGNISEARITAGKIPPDTGKYNNDRSKAFSRLFDHAIRYGDITAAKAEFDRIDDPTLKTKAATVFFRQYMAAGDMKTARSLLISIRSVIQKNESSLREIIKMLNKAGYTADAVETALMLNEEYYRSYALSDIVDAQLEAEDIEGAKKTAGLIKDSSYKVGQSAMKTIAKKLAKIGEIDEAKKTALMINDQNTKSDIYSVISEQEAAWGKFDSAKKTAELITNDVTRFDVYIKIAHVQYSAGYRKTLQETLGQAKELADKMSDAAKRAEAYSRLAYWYQCYDSDMSGVAKDILAFAKKETLRIPDPLRRSEAFSGNYYDLSKSQKIIGYFTDFRESLLSSADAAYLMKNDKSYSGSDFSSGASQLASIGDFTGAKRLADMIDSSEYAWGNALERIASSKAESGDIKGALKIFNAIPIDGGQRESIAERIAEAYLKTGNIRDAKAIIANNKKDPGYNLFEAMTKAGEMEWAWKAISKRKDDSWLEWFYMYIAEAQARKGDIGGAQKTAVNVSDSYHISVICKAMAEGGAIAQALEFVDRVKDAHYRRASYMSIAKILIKKGDVAGAGKIIDKLMKDKMNITDTIEVADLQAQIGDITGALKTLDQVHSKDAEYESWSQYKIVINMDADAVAKWQPVLEGIKDEYWRSTAYTNRIEAMKDKVAAKQLTLGISDKYQQTKIFLAMVSKAIIDNNLSHATELAGLIPYEGYRMLAFSEITSAAINKNSFVSVSEKIKQLPDSAGKTYILLDAVKGLMEAGEIKSIAALLAATKKSAAAMPDNYWKARAYAETCQMASQLGDRKMSSDLQSLADGIAGRLTENDKLLWSNYQTASSLKPIAGLKTDQKQRKKTEKWIKLIDDDLSKPLFMDMQGYIQSLTTKTAPWDIFNGLIEAADKTSAMLKQINTIASDK